MKPAMHFTDNYRQHAQEALAIEIESLEQLHHLAKSEVFSQACTLLTHIQGKVAVIGVGKSGHIGKKIAATFASVGFPAFFIHAAEALHGDLGMLQPTDCALVLSYSGSSDEVTNLLPALRDLNVPIVAITGNAQSGLAQAAKVLLPLDIKREACPHNLAPTASTTTMLVLGDMLAMALLKAKGSSKEDFARSHPAGRLGKRLQLAVCDVMQTAPLPLIDSNASLMQTLLAMSAGALGIAGIIDDDGNLIGVFTDGDLRRNMQQGNTMDAKVHHTMTRDFFSLRANTKLVDALEAFEQRRITASFVQNENNQVIGILHMHHILRSGIV